MKDKNNEYFVYNQYSRDIKKKALIGAGSIVTANILNYGFQTIGTIIFARFLLPEDFGLITMVTVFSLLLLNFGKNGFTEVIIQQKETNHQQISTLFWINIALSFALAFIFMAMSPLIIKFYHEPKLKPIIYAMSLSIIFGGFSTIHLAILQRNMRFRIVALNRIFIQIVSISTGIILAICGFGYWALIVRRLLVPFMGAIGGWVLCGWRPGLPSFGIGVFPMVKFALNTYGNFLLNYLRRNMDKILIGRFIGIKELGYYDRAYYLSTMLPAQMTNPLSNVAISTLSKLRDEPEKYLHYYSKMISHLSFIGILLSTVLILIGRDVVVLLLGPEWVYTGEIFSALGLGIGIIIIYNSHGWLHVSLGRADRWFRWGVFQLIASIVAVVIGLQFGAIGVALAYSISFCFLLVPAIWYAGRPIGLKFSFIISVTWKYYVSSILSGSFCWYLLFKINVISTIFIDLNIFIRILTAIFLCLFSYLGFIIILFQGVKPISSFLGLIKEIIPGMVKIKI